MRLIDADALNAYIESTECNSVGKALQAIDNAPTVSPDEVRGMGCWVGEGDGYADGSMVYDMWSCGVCGKYFEEWDEMPTWMYCPNCGARLVCRREVSEDD